MITESIKLFEKNYDGETIIDLPKDINRVLDVRFTPTLREIPTDKYGFHIGRFQVKVEWVSE